MYMLLVIELQLMYMYYNLLLLLLLSFFRFISKCGDLFYWFVSCHLKRVEFNPSFPVLEFLSLFHTYTFRQPEIDSFCVCLDTWGTFLDHLIMMAEDNGTDVVPHASKHHERYSI